MAGGLSLFVECFCSNVKESFDGNGKLSSLRWKSSVEGDPKVESGSNVGNGTSIPTGGALGESTDVYDELSSLSWKSSGNAIRRRNQAESLGVYESTYN